MNANKSTFAQVQTFMTKHGVRAVNWWRVLSTQIFGSRVFVRFIQNKTLPADAAAMFVWCTVTELPVHQIYARTNSWRSSFTTSHFVNIIYLPTIHRQYDQHLNKTLSLVYIRSQVSDATIALAKKEKPIKTLFLQLPSDRGVLGGIAWLIQVFKFHFISTKFV